MSLSPYPIQILQSNAGFYIGTLTPTGEPYSRESVEYYASYEEAYYAFVHNTWTQRTHY